MYAPRDLVRFRRADAPDPVIGIVLGRVGAVIEIRTADGRVHHRLTETVQPCRRQPGRALTLAA